MYIFGIVMPGSDEGTLGRASAALKLQLPARFPEHKFEFLSPQAVPAERSEEMLFRVLSAGLVGPHGTVTGGRAPRNIIDTIQTAVDEIIAAAGRTTRNDGKRA